MARARKTSDERPAGAVGDKPATVAALAERFRLTVDQLEGWGVHDLPGGKGVGIRYRDTTGEERFVRRRTHVTATGHTYQPRGVPLGCYGLWRLHLAHRLGYLVVVEGESDCWACWAHDLPALGVPGSDATACLPSGIWAPEIQTVYVWQEPDEAGARFAAQARSVLRARGYVRGIGIVRPPAGIKDVADLRCADPEEFEGALGALLLEAYPPPAPSPIPSLPEILSGAFPPQEGAEAPSEPAAPPAPSPAPKGRGRKKKTSGREGMGEGAGGKAAPAPKPAPGRRRKGSAKAGTERPADKPAPKSPRRKGACKTPPPAKGDSPAEPPTPPVQAVAIADPPEYAPGNSRRKYGRLASSLVVKPIEWLVEPWVAKGMLTLITGEANTGKSTFGAWLMAQAGRSVLMPGREEDPERLTLPRLLKHGVDLSSLLILDDDTYDPIAQRELIASIVADHGAKLLFLDPLDSYFGDGNPNLSLVVRPFLEALCWIAQKVGCGLVGVKHPGKLPGNVLPGATAWRDVPRTVLELIVDYGPPVTRIVRGNKDSLGAEMPPTYFDLVGPKRAPKLWTWRETTPQARVDELRSVPDLLERTKIAEAEEMLKGLLAKGPQPCDFVYAYMDRYKLNDRTVRRAARNLDVVKDTDGSGKDFKTIWHLPGWKPVGQLGPVGQPLTDTQS